VGIDAVQDEHDGTAFSLLRSMLGLEYTGEVLASRVRDPEFCGHHSSADRERTPERGPHGKCSAPPIVTGEAVLRVRSAFLDASHVLTQADRLSA
jgi:hypothetical protein